MSWKYQTAASNDWKYKASQYLQGLDSYHSGVEEIDGIIPQRGVIVSDADIYYRWDEFHAEHARGDKVFAYKDGVLYLSYNGGYSYTKSIAFADSVNIGMSYIFSNGNILWATRGNIYLSTDDLISYSELTVKDTDGNDWTPTGDGDSFKILSPDIHVAIDGTEYLVWGNYGNATSEANQTNIFYTIDSGVNIKIAYKFNDGDLDARHVHSVNLNSNDNSFWASTGDQADECHWLRGTYNRITDTWTWVSQGTGDSASWFKSVGRGFDTDFMYWGSDSTSDVAKYGIWKTPIDKLLDDTEYINLYSSVLIVGFLLNGDGEFLSVPGGANYEIVLISPDSGDNVTSKNITGSGLANARYWRVNPKNSQGWWRLDAAINAISPYTFDLGALWVKLK